MNKSYTAKDIKILSDREHVRLRTAIYLGSTEETDYEIPIYEENNIKIKHKEFIPALYKSFNEILDNSIDELTQINKKDKQVLIYHDVIQNKYKICDNGRGVPIDKHPQTNKYTPETVFTELRSGRNFDDNSKDSGVIGTNGVGSSCVAMLSETFKVKIKRDGKLYEQMYKNGTENIDEPFINLYKGKDTGTCIEYKIDTTLPQFKTTKLDPELIQNRTIEIALTNPQIKLNYVKKQLDENGEEEQIQKEFFFKGGFADYIKNVSERYFEFKYKSDEFDAKYYVILDKYQGIDEKVFVYVNSSLLFEGGTAAFMFFNSFVSNVINGLKKETRKRKIEVNKNDIKQNLLIIADIKMKNPRYDNQSKTRLISQEIKKYIDKMISEQISKFLSQNKEWVVEVLDRAEFRQRIADMTEVKKRQKKKKGKLEKLIDCYSKNRNECSIVFSEGDCLDKNTYVMTPNGIKSISDLKPKFDYVYTHNGIKQVIVNNEVVKKGFKLKLNLGVNKSIEIIASKEHKFPVYNIETKKIEIKEVQELELKKHKILIKNED
jgi:DNA gyrase subunit B